MSTHEDDNTGGQNTPILNANPHHNLGGVEPTAFQDIILNAKKRMVVNFIDNPESVSASASVWEYISLLDEDSKLNLKAFITGNVERFGTRALEELNNTIFQWNALLQMMTTQDKF